MQTPLKQYMDNRRTSNCDSEITQPLLHYILQQIGGRVHTKETVSCVLTGREPILLSTVMSIKMYVRMYHNAMLG